MVEMKRLIPLLIAVTVWNLLLGLILKPCSYRVHCGARADEGPSPVPCDHEPC